LKVPRAAALGAQRWRIIYHVLREGGRLACAGILLRMLGSLASTIRECRFEACFKAYSWLLFSWAAI
jgi:hypothetical protein